MSDAAGDLLLSAMASTRPLLCASELGEAWDAPSALEHMTNGDLAAHLVRAPVVTVGYVAVPTPSRIAPIDDDAYFDAAIGRQAIDAPIHEQIRARASASAAMGRDAVLDSFDQAAVTLADALPGAPTDRLVTVMGGEIVMRLDAYLLTRLIEVVVHADDLAVSIGLATPAFDTNVSEAAIAALVRVGRRRHGDLGVLRALTRRERDPDQALRIL